MQSHLDWLVIANAEPLPSAQLLKLAENKAVMVVDGALALVLQCGIRPDVVLGDFDSLDPAVKKAEEGAYTFVHAPDQTMTDLEKALMYLEKLKAGVVTLTHATGKRLDHTLYNLRLLKKFHQKFKFLSLITALEQVFYLEDQTVLLESHAPQPLALLAFPEAEVSSEGLAYELASLKLKFACQESISNHLTAQKGKIRVRGSLLLLCSHDIGLTLTPMRSA